MTVMEDGGTVMETKYYAGSYYEEICGNDGEVRKINYIFAGGKAVAIFETSNRAADLLRYVHHDHLGSVSAYTDENGNLVQELSYDAWGRRRNPVNWEYYSSTEDADAWHPRGFGGHEHLDVFDMVNMDGRMYDPILGRFLSPDPFVQAPDFTQSLNRYCYCLNNPLSLVDPSGYSWFSKNWKSLVASAVGIAVSAITAGSATGPVIAIIAGAAGGAAGAMTGALLNGANIGQIAKATLIGGLIGGASGFLNYAAGDGAFLERLFKHTFATGWLEGIQGGNMLHGFMMGATSCAGGHYLNNLHDELGYAGKLVTNTVLSGVIDEVGGGKFANGAITGAFAFMFNEAMHKIELSEELVRKIYDEADLLHSAYNNMPHSFYESLGGEFPQLLSRYDMSNTCAAKLSEAMRLSGIIIPNGGKNTVKGAHGYYYANAKKMSRFFKAHIKGPGVKIKYNDYVKYGIVFQNGGFRNASGHVDVIYNGKAAGTSDGMLYSTPKSTTLWR